LLAPWLAACHVTVLPAVGAATGPADLEAGTYAADPRWKTFTATWPQRVAAAFERLEIVTGLSFEEGARPRIRLRPFGDERVPHEVRAEIVEGRRRAVVHVNAEPLLGGVLDPDRVLLRALATAAFQDAARRHGPVPPWMVHLAATAAAGDLEERLTTQHRRAFDGAVEVARVDTTDPEAAEATGLAALLLLAERGQPDDIRRVLRFVADGDPPDAVIGRLVAEPGGGWIRPARILYRSRLAAYDGEAWRMLARAQEAVEEAGRAGLASVLPETIPVEIEDELLVLRARAAADEGAYDEARRLLASLSASAPARLQDPAAALALRIRTELHSGGDALLARRLARRLELDFPQSRAREELRRTRPLLGMEEDPQQWLALLRERIERDGTDELDLRTIERYARMLLLDHRAGAAERFLAGLGSRGEAPEFERLREAVGDAQADPSEAALTRNAKRVERWLAADDTAADDVAGEDIIDGGRAARGALLGVIARGRPDARPEAVRLLVGAIGAPETVAAVRPLWSLDTTRIGGDLQALAAAMPYGPLEAAGVVEGLEPDVLAALAPAWEALTLGLDVDWLRGHPTFLQFLRHPEFGVRRGALREIGADDPKLITPSLVAYGMRDKAALMRREAVQLAGQAGFPALARRGLVDRAWPVREEAARVVARIEGRDAVDALIPIMRSDPAFEVRAAAAQGMLKAAPSDERVIDALLAAQVAEEPRLRDAVATRLSEQEDPAPVVRGIVRGWGRALAREAPSRGYLFRTALLYQRLTNAELGYYPGATKTELRAMLAAMQAWLAARPARSVKPDERGAVRRPTGRAR
jgi:hypothetical protein